MDTRREDVEALIQDKYQGDRGADMAEDLGRLMRGEPLAYVIGWIPFLGLTIHLDSRPLIPRPETEWWTEKLVQNLQDTYGSEPFRFLDLCAGSGAIGLAVLKHFPNANVSFGEIDEAHAALIRKNIAANNLPDADIRIGDLFAPFLGKVFDVIATNPPYIPEDRTLEDSVTKYEPEIALYGGEDGLSLIRRIITEAHTHLTPGGALWIEADMDNIEEAKSLMNEADFAATIHTDLYGRPRLLVGN
ncbi:peptide chain release factor N(5)-glutamine methyltransferase [Patescibacteria group bacterium]|nr:peptide chain release factor N(5)-glutamine methyltransferase [Patescibacteria group bacterium]